MTTRRWTRLSIGNTITNNFNNGLSSTADGSATGGLTVNIERAIPSPVTRPTGSNISTAGAAILKLYNGGCELQPQWCRTGVKSQCDGNRRR